MLRSPCKVAFDQSMTVYRVLPEQYQTLKLSGRRQLPFSYVVADVRELERCLFILGPVVQSVISLTSVLRVISFTVLADSVYNILIFFAEKMCSHFSSQKFQHICVSLDVNFNESLTNDIVSFEQLGSDFLTGEITCVTSCLCLHVHTDPLLNRGLL